MRQLNYNHLHYFWVVAREGSIARACEQLHLTPQTVSAQVKLLEESVGKPLFHRVGRGLVLSPMGEAVMRYADDMFSTGQELGRFLHSGEFSDTPVFHVGITESIAKLVVYRILQPAMEETAGVRVVCEEDRLAGLVDAVANHRLDLIISDAPLTAERQRRVWNHHLGYSGICIFASPALARRYRDGFPRSLHGAPFLMPTPGSSVRGVLDDWFAVNEIVPEVVAEIADAALLKSFGGEGAGLFAGATVIEKNIRSMYGVEVVGSANDMYEQFYAISPERKIRQPLVLNICDRARTEVFGTG